MPAWNNGQLVEVYRRLAQANIGHVVVGGQAANLWAEHYQARAIFPEQVWRALMPFTSTDLDLFGGSMEADRAGQAFGVKTRLYNPFDRLPAPNSGTLSIPMSEGEAISPATSELMIHFLHRVHGLNSDDVRSSALLLEYSGVAIPVLHPLLCLEAKVSNLHDFDQGNPPRQDLKHARMCALAVRAYTAERLAAGHVREGLDTFERIMRLAGHQSGLVAWYAHGLDLMEVIPHDTLGPVAAGEPKIANFLERRWDQLQAKLADQRDHFETVTQHQGRAKHSPRPLLDFFPAETDGPDAAP